MKFWNNGVICIRAVENPGDEWMPGRLKFKRKSPSEETKKKIKLSNIGKLAWNKGKTDYVSDATRDKMSASAKLRAVRGIIPDNTGNTPWNKGLTQHTEQRIADVANNQRGKARTGNYPKREQHWNWKDIDTYSKPYAAYAQKVHNLTKLVYNKHKNILNPHNFPRGRAGIEGAYQLDHIISIHFGFLNNIPPEELAKLENLQFIPWKENRMKSNK